MSIEVGLVFLSVVVLAGLIAGLVAVVVSGAARTFRHDREEAAAPPLTPTMSELGDVLKTIEEVRRGRIGVRVQFRASPGDLVERGPDPLDAAEHAVLLAIKSRALIVEINLPGVEL